MSSVSSWRSSLICCQTTASLYRALITYSALHYSSLPTLLLPPLPSPPCPFILTLFFNLTTQSSTPPVQIAILAAGEGIILDECVSINRYMSTYRINSVWMSASIILCVSEYEMLLSERRAEGVKLYITQRFAVSGDS